MDLNSIMHQAQEMQKKIAGIQEELKKKTVNGSSGGGMVMVTANGGSEILAVNIEPALINSNDQKMLQDLITAATNDALRKAKELGKQEMSKLTGGFNVPGISNLFS